MLTRASEKPTSLLRSFLLSSLFRVVLRQSIFLRISLLPLPLFIDFTLFSTFIQFTISCIVSHCESAFFILYVHTFLSLYFFLVFMFCWTFTSVLLRHFHFSLKRFYFLFSSLYNRLKVSFSCLLLLSFLLFFLS